MGLFNGSLCMKLSGGDKCSSNGQDRSNQLECDCSVLIGELLYNKVQHTVPYAHAYMYMYMYTVPYYYYSTKFSRRTIFAFLCASKIWRCTV